jgi:hypothetical protein
MRCPPTPGFLHGGRPLEIVLVLGSREPLAPAFLRTRLLALALVAVVLIPKMPRVRPEERPTMQTLTITPPPPVGCFHSTIIGNAVAQTEENSFGEEDGKKMIQRNLFEENGEQENCHFQTGRKPAVSNWSPQYSALWQSGSITKSCDREKMSRRHGIQEVNGPSMACL